MFVIWMCAGAVRHEIAEVDTEQEAIDYCEQNNWELVGENMFAWSLDYTERPDTIQFDTYPDMFTDYENMIENENYDNERRVFVVPRDWALKWIDENSHYDDGFWNEYTYDDTIRMYEDAVTAGVLISETIEPECFMKEDQNA